MYDMLSLRADNRRESPRLRLNVALNEYFGNEGHQGLALNVSESGLSIRKPVDVKAPRRTVVGVELELPGTNEVIWASAQARFHTAFPGFQLSGLHFLSMASKHQRLLRDYVRERHARLVRLLTPRTLVHSRFGAPVS